VGGIVGEDGFDGIHLGLTPPGNVFYEFQSHLKSLSDRGIILAINSKNNFNDAIKVIREHPHMILKENDFACMVINWENKVENMKAIANQLNIGLDSIVFFDDDPVNREFMRKNLPEVTVPELSSDPSELSKILLDMNDFSTFQITNDDIQRSKTYSDQKKRLELEKTSTNIDDFLNSLNMKLTIKKATSFTIPRISQLTLKTNQFNLTTKRYQEKNIQQFVDDSNMLVGCAQVEDKFGDNGITGVFIVNKSNPKEWELDTFLLSCRVMGREIEKGLINYIIEIAKESNVKKIKAKYIPTEKNQPIEKFLKSCDFKEIDNY
jgi:FkbH-like protein